MINNDDQRWMKQALAIAAQAECHGEVPIGAVIIKHGQLITTACNQPISSCDPTAHAEIMVMRQAAKQLGNYRLVDCELYVTLEPCLMCLGAMIQARIKRLVFAAYDQRFGTVKQVLTSGSPLSINHRLIWRGGVLADSASELLTKFFKARRTSKRSAE